MAVHVCSLFLALFCLNYGIFVISINVLKIKISSSTYFEFGILRHLAKGWVSLAKLTLAQARLGQDSYVMVSLGQVWKCQARLGQDSYVMVSLGQLWKGQARLGFVQVQIFQVRLGQVKLDKFQLGMVWLGNVCMVRKGLVRVRLGWFRLGLDRLGKVWLELGQVSFSCVWLGYVRFGQRQAR